MKTRKRIAPIEIEGAHLVYRNFSGKGDKYTREGDRSVSVVIEDPELAKVLSDDGWNIKQFSPREDDPEEPAHFLKAKIKYGEFPPNIFMVGSNGPVRLSAESVGELDYKKILTADVVITPYEYTMHGETGITAYVKTLYAVVEEDHLASKYAKMYPRKSECPEEEKPFE